MNMNDKIEFESYVDKYAICESKLMFFEKQRLFNTRYYKENKEQVDKIIFDLNTESFDYLNKMDEICSRKEPV